MGKYAIGVDLGGTNLRVAAVDDAGAIRARVSVKTDVRERRRDDVIADLCRAVDEVCKQMDQLSLEGSPGVLDLALCGIGVGVAGIIDSESGMLLESPNLPGWNDYDVKGEIERRLGTAVILENDANVAALGEQWRGAGRGIDDLCIYTLGTGVGGGIVLGGRLWRGWNGMAGELGHYNVEPEGHPCNCGSRGCLEQYASATAVVRMAQEAIAGDAPTRLRDLAVAELDARSVYQCAMQGDVEAVKVFERMGRALGLAIGSMINAMNLPLYVIGGGVAAAWDAFAPAMYGEIRRRSFVYASTTMEEGRAAGGRTRSTSIRRAALGGDAGLYGAARLPMIERP